MWHSYLMFNVWGVKCDMLLTQSNILVLCIPNRYPYFAFTFLRLTCNIRVFQCNVDPRCVCCGAECDMPIPRSNILLWTSNFTLEWTDLEMVSLSTSTITLVPRVLWLVSYQDGCFQMGLRHFPADYWNTRQFRDNIVSNWWNISENILPNPHISNPW